MHFTRVADRGSAVTDGSGALVWIGVVGTEFALGEDIAHLKTGNSPSGDSCARFIHSLGSGGRALRCPIGFSVEVAGVMSY
jgi:hypothetical protein